MSGWAMKTAEGEMQREKTTAGRRIAKSYDGQTVARYLYDGGHILADYDGNGALLHKYIYGPDTPPKSEAPSTKSETSSKHQSAMIETRPPARWTVWDFGRQSLGFVSSFDIRISDLSPCYYHYDGLGSVVALSDEAGDTVEVYEYGIFGQVAASDPNHPNRFLFTGREFDSETGLYYYRARYYNPYIGRFLQTDPAGQGMNAYAYCRNDPIVWADPSGCCACGTCHVEEVRHTYDFTFPVECLGLDPDLALYFMCTPTVASQLINRFFGTTTGFYDKWPEWTVQCYSLSTDDAGTPQVTVTFASTYLWQPEPPRWGSMRVEIAVVLDDEPLGTIIDHVPLVVYDNTALLPNHALERIIRPAIQEINGWYSLGCWTAPMGLYHLAYSWDSWFVSSYLKFLWKGSTYQYPVEYAGSEVNYIVGGHAFAHYGIPELQAAAWVYAWKIACRVGGDREIVPPWDVSLEPTWFWFWTGYYQYEKGMDW
jgi:RHS repeat-associated protein